MIRVTTGLAHVMAGGGKLGIPLRLLATFGRTMVFHPGYQPCLADAMPMAQVVVIIAVAAVMGVALGSLQDDDLGGLVLRVTLQDEFVLITAGGQS